MADQRLLITNGQIVSPTDILRADIGIEGEKIVAISAPGVLDWSDARRIDATDCFVLPGLVDPHTHIQLDTGVFKTADDWEIGTKVAAYGGVTTVVDFATQFPGMSFPEALERRLEECQPAYIDYSHHMMVTDPPATQAEYRSDLQALRDLGVPSIKLYTTYRPNYYMDDAALMRTFEAMPSDMLALIHCENDALVTAATHGLLEAGKTGWEFHGQARPWQAEIEAVQRVVGLATLANAAVYIVHCTLPATLLWLHTTRRTLEKAERILFETCPQYFTLHEGLYRSATPEHFILQPPLRGMAHMLNMQQIQGLADVISTDHCDYTLAQKQEFREFVRTPGGLPGLETSLQLTYTYAEMADIRQIVAKMSAMPAKIFGLYPRKGALLPGSDADIVIYDPRAAITLQAENLHTIGGYSPYEGMKVRGEVRTTISRGAILVHDGEFLGEKGRGQFLKAAPFSGSV